MKLHINSTHCTVMRFASFLSSGSNKSTGKEAGKTHLYALCSYNTLSVCISGQCQVKLPLALKD